MERTGSCRSRTMPIGRRVLDEAGEFDLKEGFALSLLLTLDGQAVGFSLAGEHFEMGPDMQRHADAYCELCHRACDHAYSRKTSSNQPIMLSAREREALQWAAEGKNDWEIGEVMNISEHGADKHLRAGPREARSDQPHTGGSRSDPARIDRIKVREPVLSPSICHRHFLINHLAGK